MLTTFLAPVLPDQTVALKTFELEQSDLICVQHIHFIHREQYDSHQTGTQIGKIPKPFRSRVE